MPSRRALAVSGLAALAAGARWRAAADADPAAVRRKVAVATWRAPKEGRLLSRVVVDAEPLLDYVASRRAVGAQGLSLVHVLGAACARALLAVPQANARVLGGRAVPFADVAVGFAVDVGAGTDLAPVTVRGADRLTPAALATEVRRGVAAVREGHDAGFRRSTRVAAAVPAPLLRPLLAVSSLVLGGLGLPMLGQQGHPLGAVFVSNLAPLGLEEAFLAPVPFARAHVYVALGTVTERAVVRAGEVVPVRQLTLCLTGDHRLVDGVQCAAYVARLQALLADPAALDSPVAA